MGCIRRLFRIDRSPAPSDPDSVSRALCTGVPAVGGAQPTPRGGPTLHEIDEPTVRNPDAAHSRRCRSLRLGRSSRTYTALRAARSLRINIWRRTFQSRREAGRSQRSPVAFPQAGLPVAIQLTHSPVDTGAGARTGASWAATSLGGGT